MKFYGKSGRLYKSRIKSLIDKIISDDNDTDDVDEIIVPLNEDEVDMITSPDITRITSVNIVDNNICGYDDDGNIVSYWPIQDNISNVAKFDAIENIANKLVSDAHRSDGHTDIIKELFENDINN